MFYRSLIAYGSVEDKKKMRNALLNCIYIYIYIYYTFRAGGGW